MIDWGSYLEFFHEWRTDVWLAEQSGIPRTTLGFVRRGERSLPAQYSNALRSAYQSGMHGILREEGFPKRVAFQYSFIGRERFNELRSELDVTIAQTAVNWTAQGQYKAEQDNEYFDPLTYYKEVYDKAAEAIYYSELPWDDIKERYAP